MEKTYVIIGQPEQKWVVVDANEQSLGRLSTKIASYLLGKHKPTFTRGTDMGDYVIVINAEKLKFSQTRLADKFYYRHSGYPGGLKTISLRDQLKLFPERIIKASVWGMIPHGPFGRQVIKRLKVYAGNEHPHQAQNPEVVE